MQRTHELIFLQATPRFVGLLPSALATLAIWRRRWRTRRQLAMLDARELADLGLGRAQQQAEAGKWFWQA
jgi:uncharacterized protein YjiS (DUF1127 family)